MPNRIQAVLSFVLTVTAVLMGFVLVHREFYGGTQGQVGRSAAEPTYVRNWRELTGSGVAVGDTMARVEVVWRIETG